MFTLTIQVASLDELESFIASIRHSAPTRLVAEVTQAADTQIPAQLDKPVAEPRNPEPEAEEPKAEEPKAEAPKRGRGRPRKEPEAGATTSEPTGDQPKPLSLDEARAALQELVTTKGMDTAFGVLKQYGAQRVSELQAADYGKFIDACKAA